MTISMASNRGTGPLKLSEKKYSRPLETVYGVFGKDKPPVRKNYQWKCKYLSGCA